MELEPSFPLLEVMYFIPSAPLICSSSGVATVSGGDAWARGCKHWYGGAAGAVIGAWSGTAWKLAPPPSLGQAHFLYGVAAVSARDAWAVGINEPAGKTLILHWNGKAWKTS